MRCLQLAQRIRYGKACLWVRGECLDDYLLYLRRYQNHVHLRCLVYKLSDLCQQLYVLTLLSDSSQHHTPVFILFFGPLS
jgi:hypothetical protein